MRARRLERLVLMSQLRLSVLGASVALLALVPPGLSPALADGLQAPHPDVRRIDLHLGQGVASIAARRGARGFVVGFAKCRIVVLDGDAVPGDRYDIPGCKTLFTVRPGELEGAEAIVASTYTGRTAVISGGKVAEHKVHDAAVTDSYLVGRSLVSSSDDGSVRQLPLPGAPGTMRVLTTDIGVARVLLPDPAAQAGAPAFFAGFDSGRIRAVAGEGTAVRTYESGVGRINALGLASDRRSVLVAGFDGRLRAVDLASGRATDLLAAGDGINAMALDRAHARVGVVSDDGSFILLDLAARAELARAKLAEGPLTALAFDGTNSKALAGDSAGLLYLLTLPAPHGSQASDGK